MDRKMIGRSRGRPTTRLHAAIDALGNSPRVTLPSGQVADIEQAATLIRDQPACFIVTDKGYDSNAFVEPMTAQGDQAVIRPRSHRLNPRAFDRHLDQDRICSNVPSTARHFRRPATRYDKLATSCISFIRLACPVGWLD